MDLLAIMERRRLPPLPFPLEDGPRAEEMCLLLAEDRLTDRAIAKKIDVAYSTLALWKKKPECRARIALYRGEMAAQIFKTGLANRETRVAALADRWQRMHGLMEARAEEYATDPEATGGDTGLIVRTVKVTPKGDKIVEFAFDSALFKEMRETEKQAAIELGQWTEKRANLNLNVDAESNQFTEEQTEAIRAFLTAPNASPPPEESPE